MVLICPLEGKKNLQARPLYYTGRLSLSHAVHAHKAFDVDTGREYHLEIKYHFRAILADKASVHMHQVPAASTLRTYSLLGDCDPGMSDYYTARLMDRVSLPKPPSQRSPRRVSLGLLKPTCLRRRLCGRPSRTKGITARQPPASS